MTRIYHMKTKDGITTEPMYITGFTINKGDVLNVNGIKYTVCEIEYILKHTSTRTQIAVDERKIYVEEYL